MNSKGFGRVQYSSTGVTVLAFDWWDDGDDDNDDGDDDDNVGDDEVWIPVFCDVVLHIYLRIPRQ